MDLGLNKGMFPVEVGGANSSEGATGVCVTAQELARIDSGFATACLRLPVSDCSGSMRCYRVAALERLGIGNRLRHLHGNLMRP